MATLASPARLGKRGPSDKSRSKTRKVCKLFHFLLLPQKEKVKEFGTNV